MDFSYRYNLRSGHTATLATNATKHQENALEREKVAKVATVAIGLKRKKEGRQEVANPSPMPENYGKRLYHDTERVLDRFGITPPMFCDDVPDWRMFCQDYPRCDVLPCPHFVESAPCWCRLWEHCFPGKVKWYSSPC